MSHPGPRKSHGNHERWLVSYADFITLLFAFFVVMFASSQTDKARARRVSDSVMAAFEKIGAGGARPRVAKVLGGTVDDAGAGNAQANGPGGAQRSAQDSPDSIPAELLPSMQALNKGLQDEIRAGKLTIHLEARGMVISLQQSALFRSGEDRVDAAIQPVFEHIAQTLHAIPNQLRIEGHTDSVPISNSRFRNNWELSVARSLAVMRVMADKYKVPEGRLVIVGYGENAAVDSNDSPAGRARNRRVDLVIQNMPALIPAAETKKRPAASESRTVSQ